MKIAETSWIEQIDGKMTKKFTLAEKTLKRNTKSLQFAIKYS